MKQAGVGLVPVMYRQLSLADSHALLRTFYMVYFTLLIILHDQKFSLEQLNIFMREKFWLTPILKFYFS